MHRSSRRRGIATGSTIALLAAALALPAAAQGADPGTVGSISGLFEERPDQPFCETDEDENGDGFVTCKPTAVSTAVLGDGQVIHSLRDWSTWSGTKITGMYYVSGILPQAGRP